MTIQIPQGAKTMQFFDLQIAIPEGKSFIELDDDFVKSKYEQFSQNQGLKQENLTLDKKPMSAHQAPQISQIPQRQSQNALERVNEKMAGVNEAINPFNLITKGLSYLSPRETSGEEGVRQKIEDAANQISGGLINRTLFDLSEEEQKQIHKIAYDEIKKLGYEPFLQRKNGEFRYIGVGKNGTEVDFTPNFKNMLASSKNEIALSVAGAGSGALASGAGGSLGKQALHYFAPSAVGAGSGALADLHGQGQNTGIKISQADYVKRFGSAAVEDALAGAAVAGMIKGVGKTYKSVNDVIKKAKTGADAGKEMIDGVMTKGGHLKENLGDKLRQISPNIVNDFLSQGDKTSKTYAKDLIESARGNYDEAVQNANMMPLEINQGHALIDGVAKKTKELTEDSKFAFLRNGGNSVGDALHTLGKNLGSKEAAQNQQNLINLSMMNGDLATVARDILASDPKIANQLATTLSVQDDALLKGLNLNKKADAKALYSLREARAKRAYETFGKGIEELDKLNPKGVKIDQKALDEMMEDYGIYAEATPAKIKEFLKEAKSGALDGKSVKEIYDRIEVIGKKLKGDKSYNYEGFLKGLKDEFLESMVRNSSNDALAKDILENIRKDYANFKTYDESKIGKKLKGSEKNITNEIDKILNETNSKKNYEAITKGLSEEEVKILDQQIIARALEKHQINLGDANKAKMVTNYKDLIEDLENFSPKSKVAREQMQVLNTIAKLRSQFETIIDGVLNTKAKGMGHGISTDFKERAKTMFVNAFTDHIAFFFLRMIEVGKRAGLRIQMRRGFAQINDLKDFDKAAKDFIHQIKDKSLKEEAMGAKKEFKEKINGMVKDLQKEQKALYNVAYNGKNATLVKKDLEAVDEAILFEKGTKRKGGKHIRLAHSIEPLQQGYVTKNEVVNLGANIRKFLKEYKEPFTDKNGARIYEWEKNGVRFRLVVNNVADMDSNPTTATQEIITFYSDRNLKTKMEFKNPALRDEKIRLKGENFFMDQPSLKGVKSDYRARLNVQKWVNELSGILSDEWVVNLKAMAKKHPEMFKSEADVFRVIKEIKDNPTHFFKNYDNEVALIAKPLKDDKAGNIAIKKENGQIIHVNKTKSKDLERLSRRNKEMLTGTPLPATTKGKSTDVAGDLLQHSLSNSTQAKPKSSLIQRLDERIKEKEAWMKTFNLKSIDEAYTPNFSTEVKKALAPVLKGEEIRLTKGSFEKLLKRERMELLPYIKETLENADAVVKQVDGNLIFAKDYREGKLGKFFASVSKENNGEWIIASNAPKTLNNLQNKIKEGGEVIYSHLPELPIIAKPELSAKALSGEANARSIIPQNAEKILQNDPLNAKILKAQREWLDTFNLKSIDEAYTPNFSTEVKKALAPVLKGEEIRLTKGSFEKLLKRERMELLPYIKETLENADAVVKDKENAVIFVKDIDKKSYFTSVAKNAKGEWVISSNSYKTLNTLKNRVDDKGEVLFLSKEASNILAEAFTKRAFSNELARGIIAQKGGENPEDWSVSLREIKQKVLKGEADISEYEKLSDAVAKKHYDYILKKGAKFDQVNDVVSDKGTALKVYTMLQRTDDLKLRQKTMKAKEDLLHFARYTLDDFSKQMALKQS